MFIFAFALVATLPLVPLYFVCLAVYCAYTVQCTVSCHRGQMFIFQILLIFKIFNEIVIRLLLCKRMRTQTGCNCSIVPSSIAPIV